MGQNSMEMNFEKLAKTIEIIHKNPKTIIEETAKETRAFIKQN